MAMAVATLGAGLTFLMRTGTPPQRPTGVGAGDTGLVGGAVARARSEVRLHAEQRQEIAGVDARRAPAPSASAATRAPIAVGSSRTAVVDDANLSWTSREMSRRRNWDRRRSGARSCSGPTTNPPAPIWRCWSVALARCRTRGCAASPRQRRRPLWRRRRRGTSFAVHAGGAEWPGRALHAAGRVDALTSRLGSLETPRRRVRLGNPAGDGRGRRGGVGVGWDSTYSLMPAVASSRHGVKPHLPCARAGPWRPRELA